MPDIAHAAVATAASASRTATASATGTIQVMEVLYKPVADVTGANTNTRQLRLRNTTVPADVATLQLNAGVNLVGGRWNRIPLVAAGPVQAAITGQALAFESNAVGTGLADPGGTVRVRWERIQSLAQRSVNDPQGRPIVTPPELSLDVDPPTEPGG